MDIIICRTCNETIGHHEGEKVATLYGTCSSCSSREKSTAKKK
ncbi:GapA-binding peptide SR1P [Salsuginibacillus kocurii]|nr:GapA-binding peptide SR1P [Salsuginibacillus kocurii]